jgi:hypothetical protein
MRKRQEQLAEIVTGIKLKKNDHSLVCYPIEKDMLEMTTFSKVKDLDPNLITYA